MAMGAQLSAAGCFARLALAPKWPGRATRHYRNKNRLQRFARKRQQLHI